MKCLAIDTVTVEYFGRAAHAGATPWEGINAVDAMMQAWDNISMLRQQTLTTNRIHGIITDGGKSVSVHACFLCVIVYLCISQANVIPDYASCTFLARSVTKEQLAELKIKMENCIKAAAVATGCQVKLQWSPKGPTDGTQLSKENEICKPMDVLLDVFQNEPLAETYKHFMEAQGIKFFPKSLEESVVSGSTDMGNFSYAVPTIHPG